MLAFNLGQVQKEYLSTRENRRGSKGERKFQQLRDDAI